MSKWLLFLSLLLAPVGGALAAVHPDLEWKTLRSAHFDLVFDARHHEVALLYLDRLERARRKLVPLWPEFPGRLTVVLNDRTDLTNGYATALPYAHVVIFPVLPGPQESISEYGDWAEEIAIHELTHILSFETRRGGARFLASIFGNIITPNLLLPRWWLEGVAVDSETRLSSHGRLRSSYQDATLRALASSSRWNDFSLAEINEFQIPTWPYGARPYLFGSLLWSEMIALKGEKMIGDLHHAFGGRVPYFLSGPVRERFDGQDLPRLFRRAKDSIARAVADQERTLKSVPLSETAPFRDPDFKETLTPRISPDGLKMAFLARDNTLKRSIQVLMRPGRDVPFAPEHRVRSFGQKEEVTTPAGPEIGLPRGSGDAPPGGTINRISWMPDSSAFVFDLVSEKDMFSDVSDLWIFSLPSGKGERLSRDLRAREPEVSPDGKRVAFVQLEGGRSSLAVFDLESKKVSVPFRPALLSRVAWPAWLDEDRILFTLREKGGEKLMIARLSTATAEPAPLSLRESTLPFTRNGKVHFISQENGVRNLYVADGGLRHARPLTHLWTGAFASDLDEARGDLWVTQVGPFGFELARLSPREDLPARLPAVETLLNDRYPRRATEPEPERVASEASAYDPLPYLRPRYWLPFLYWDDKGTQVSVNTGSFDPLQKHLYTLFASYDSATERGSYALRYQNQSFLPTLNLIASDLSSYLADASQPTRTRFSLAQASWQLPSLSPHLFVAFGWSWLGREQIRERTYQTGPTAGLLYHRVSQTGEQISPESGGLAHLTTTQFLEGGDREHYNLTTLALTKYGRVPWWGNRHAWMARFVGQSVDREVRIANYESTLSTLSGAAPSTQSFLMRGYVTGAFLGKSLANTSLEYRFPIRRIDSGSDTAPLFVRRLSGAVVADGIWLEGYAYDTTREPFVYRRVTPWKGFGSAGFEAKLDLTLGYHFEMQLVTGIYAPVPNEYTESAPRLGFGLAL